MLGCRQVRCGVELRRRDPDGKNAGLRPLPGYMHHRHNLGRAIDRSDVYWLIEEHVGKATKALDDGTGFSGRVVRGWKDAATNECEENLTITIKAGLAELMRAWEASLSTRDARKASLRDLWPFAFAAIPELRGLLGDPGELQEKSDALKARGALALLCLWDGMTVPLNRFYVRGGMGEKLLVLNRVAMPLAAGQFGPSAGTRHMAVEESIALQVYANFSASEGERDLLVRHPSLHASAATWTRKRTNIEKGRSGEAVDISKRHGLDFFSEHFNRNLGVCADGVGKRKFESLADLTAFSGSAFLSFSKIMDELGPSARASYHSQKKLHERLASAHDAVKGALDFDATGATEGMFKSMKWDSKSAKATLDVSSRHELCERTVHRWLERLHDGIQLI